MKRTSTYDIGVVCFNEAEESRLWLYTPLVRGDRGRNQRKTNCFGGGGGVGRKLGSCSRGNRSVEGDRRRSHSLEGREEARGLYSVPCISIERECTREIKSKQPGFCQSAADAPSPTNTKPVGS